MFYIRTKMNECADQFETSNDPPAPPRQTRPWPWFVPAQESGEFAPEMSSLTLDDLGLTTCHLSHSLLANARPFIQCQWGWTEASLVFGWREGPRKKPLPAGKSPTVFKAKTLAFLSFFSFIEIFTEVWEPIGQLAWFLSLGAKPLLFPHDLLSEQ